MPGFPSAFGHKHTQAEDPSADLEATSSAQAEPAGDTSESPLASVSEGLATAASASVSWGQIPRKRMTIRPRPRCLIWGFSYKQQEEIGALFAESKVILSLDDVHQADWDLLIAHGVDVANADPHLFVIAFGGLVIGGIKAGGVLIARGYQYPDEATSGAVSHARDFDAFTTTPPLFDALVSSDLIPLVKQEDAHSALIAYTQTGDKLSEPSLAVPAVTPLLVGSDGAIIAAVLDRSPKSKCLTLPPDASRAWITAAINEWHKLAPKIFPETTDWTSGAYDWITPDEIDAGLAAIDADRVKEAAEAKAKVAWEVFWAAREVAASGIFRLLTGTGTPLEEAVSAALRDLGFMVREMDAEWPEGQRFEDLRVTCNELPDWEAIVEIKGYSKSRGHAEDITNLVARFGKNYRRMQKRDPSAYWYVVNHDFATHPEQRKSVLEGNEFDIETLALDDGLAIDTVDLYRLWHNVKRGRVTPEAARAKLVGSKGRFSHDWAPATKKTDTAS